MTGASNGIGRAVAAQLAAHGAHVLAVARDEARLRTLEREPGRHLALCRSRRPRRAPKSSSAPANWAVPPFSSTVPGRGGYLDRTIFEQTSDDWRQTLAVNLDAVLRTFTPRRP